MNTAPRNKILRDEALRHMEKSDIFHSSGLLANNSRMPGAANMNYQQRQEMLRQYVGQYNKSKLGATRNPGMRARAVEPKQSASLGGTRFDARIGRGK